MVKEWPMSGSGSGEAQLRAFRDKVKRIEKRGPVLQMAPVGAADQQSGGRRRRRKQARAAERAQMPKVKVNPIVFAVAFALGCAAVIAVRYGRAEWLTDYLGPGLTGAHAGLAMLADFGAALVLGVVLKAMLGAKGPHFAAAHTIGAGIMVLTMHDFVHAAPELWAKAFPLGWVNEVVATTQPRSILIKGISFEL